MVLGVLDACHELQRLVKILTRLIGIDLFVINSEYLCVAGSGAYESAVGCVSPRDTAIGYSLVSGRATMVANPRDNDTCHECSQRLTCRDLSNYTAPITVRDRVVAAVQAVAFNKEQCVILKEKAPDIAETITLFLVQTCEANARMLTALGGSGDEPETAGLERLVGESSAMRALKDDIIRCAPLDSTVLLQGESGTGKELAAQAIHDLSLRASEPFVAVNCGAIPESIIESELFGYTSGTFTGAQKGGKPGLFEHADGGTLFLDEIAELPLALQVKLLRVLQERKVMRLGGRKEHEFDVRIIAAANVDLAERARSGKFRQDLYYRLSVIPLHVPSLRHREGDVELLVNHFVRLYARRRGETPPPVAPELMRRFIEYSWPGNVRELKNFVEYGINLRKGRSLNLATLAERFNAADNSLGRHNFAPWEPLNGGHCPSTISPGGAVVHQPEAPGRHGIPVSGARPRNDWDKEVSEQEALIQALSRHGATLDGKKRVAQELGISVATLYRKIKKYGLLEAYRYDVG
ncbi:AAA domain-containing protein [Pseudodesulfovibrio cashew]|uniref:AAA domain-containing protein n=1 Tax=Pseudodesulfovibrio cashew TaxID=2678688 RepID=A0A6I6JSB5_9BACT|nr:sigma 54-interacting transcriptional regulator [Pseudodesulfovibrio cashew]QGY40444.1 AAA domain-containing protein [Pseudodesulfovibrio cashew]